MKDFSVAAFATNEEILLYGKHYTAVCNPTDRIYISGPMAGLPEKNHPAFFAAEAAIAKLGFVVENPAHNWRNRRLPDTWATWMRSAIAQLVRCEGLVLLPGWENSKGATCEERLARELDIRVFTLEEFLDTGHMTFVTKTGKEL